MSTEKSKPLSGPTPFILISALLYEGKLYVGLRHSDCIHRAARKTGHRNIRGEQGFLTSDITFVDRAQAATIAYEAGQIPKRVKALCSEDVW